MRTLHLRRDERDVVVMSKPHCNGLVPSVHHAVATPNPQHAFLREPRLLGQHPLRLESADLAPLTPLSLDHIFHTRRAVRVDLRGAGAAIYLLLERSRELLAVLH